MTTKDDLHVKATEVRGAVVDMMCAHAPGELVGGRSVGRMADSWGAIMMMMPCRSRWWPRLIITAIDR